MHDSFPAGTKAFSTVPRVKVLACFALAAVGLVTWHLHFSFKLFAGMDGGVLINAAWMQLNGAVPYRDFYTACPPIFLLPAGWAFLCFGPAWASFTKLVCLFSLLTFTWTFLLLWRLTALPWRSLVGALAVQLLTMLPLSWWWYNEITAVTAIIFYAALGGIVIHPASPFLRASFLLSEALLGLSKVNIAAPVLFLGVLFLLLHQRVRTFALVATLLAGLFDVGLLAWNHITLGALLQNYALASENRLSYRVWQSFLWQPIGDPGQTGIYWALWAEIAAALAIFLAEVQSRREKALLIFLWSIAFVAGCSGASFEYAGKPLHIGYLIILLFFLCPARLWPPYSLAWVARGMCGLFLGLSILLNIYLGGTRAYFRHFGVGSYVNPSHRVTMAVPPLFKGLQVAPDMVNTVHDAAQALLLSGWPKDSSKRIFFGPHVDYGYAAFNVPVPVNLPLWWEGVPAVRSQRFDISSFAEGDMPVWRYPRLPAGHALDPRVQRFLDAKFDACIFMIDLKQHPYMTYLPVDIRYVLFRDYRMTYIGHVVLFQRRVP